MKVIKFPRKMFHRQWGKAFVKMRDCTKTQSCAARSSMNDPKKSFRRQRRELGDSTRQSFEGRRERKGMNGRGKKFINDDRPRFSRNWTAAAFHRPPPKSLFSPAMFYRRACRRELCIRETFSHGFLPRGAFLPSFPPFPGIKWRT